MSDAAVRGGGTRVIVQGVGVGVRNGTEYLLFERDDGESPAGETASTVTADSLYAMSTRWLSEHGIHIAPSAIDAPDFVRQATGARLDHVAFAAEDLDAILAVIRGNGAGPVSRTSETAAFLMASGRRLEIVRASDRPETYWCPMHVDVRSADAGKCALCGMDLVPIPPPRIGQYRMDVAFRPEGLRLVIRDPAGAEAIRRFATVHDRPFHLFIVGRDLTYFAHEHPQAADDGTLQLRHVLPPGEYMLIADFLPQGGTPQILQRAIVTPDYRGAVFLPLRELAVDTSEKEVEGTRIRLEVGELAARRPATLRFTLSDPVSGTAVADLEPFLGAPGHMLIVNADLTEAIHAHPEGTTAAGPSITFEPVLPAAGKYKLWAQFQRKGKVLTATFAIEVRG